MKRISFKLFGVAAVIATTFSASAQNTETRKVNNFHGVGAAGPFAVHIKIDGQENLRITGPAEILKEIETPVEDGVLEIRFRRDYYRENFNEKIDVYVSAKALSSLSCAGAIKMDVDGALTGEKIKISTAGAGKMTSEVKGGTLDASTAGAGDLVLKGSVNTAKYSLSGAGKLNARELKSEDVKISIAGSGEAHVFADKTISASVAGSGRISYTGNATISNFSSAGSGHITKEKGE
jgi:hypothetical protein